MPLLVLGCGGGEPEWALCDDGKLCSPAVDVLTSDNELPLDPDAAFWTSADGPKKTVIELGPQLITNPQWPDPSIKNVTVSAAKTGSHIAVRLEWDDASVDNKFSSSNLYTDQAAVMFPLNVGDEVPLITMGEEGSPVNIWLWKAVWQKDVDSVKTGSGKTPKGFFGSGFDSPVDDLNAEGFSTLTAQEHKDVFGKGIRSEKGWRVVFKRKLANADSGDIQFENYTPMAIAAWNGSNRETNGQKGIAGWILLRF